MIIKLFDNKMTEQEFIDRYSPAYVDDQQGFYFKQMTMILSGDLGMELNENHEQAWIAETASLRQYFGATNEHH
jgi:hypothetical protein